MKKVILCSASPRRRELLSEIIPDFEIRVSSAPERSTFKVPHKRVMDLAAIKQEGIFLSEGEIAISADTLVYRGGKYYGKPKSEEDARKMLRELSGRTHYVYTGVMIRTVSFTRSFYDKTAVIFKSLSDEEIEEYVRDFSPLDKAGAYGVQDGVVVKRIKGSYSNVVGLPMEKLKEELKKSGVHYDR